MYMASKDRQAASAVPKTEIQALISKEMADRDMTTEDLRGVIHTTSESARRFAKGIKIPADPLLKLMSDYFNWDYEEVKQIAIRDRERIKHGDLFDKAHGDEPDVQKFARSWPLLTTSQKNILKKQLNEFLVFNKIR